MIYFFVLFILLILAALVIALVISNSITNVVCNRSISKIYGGTEYNYVITTIGSHSIFDEIRQLVNNMINGIDSEKELFERCIEYKGVSLLLKNILILKKMPPYGIYLELGSIEIAPSDMEPFTSYYEPFLTICTFDQIMDEYDRFKETKQSYLIYWINLLNIFRILIRFNYDNILNGAYLDSNNECNFMALVNIFIVALNCEYSDILIAYKKYIEYIICTNKDIPSRYGNSIKEYSIIVDQLLRLNETDAYLLLSANSISETRYGIFEGTKFLISSSNPYKIADEVYSDVVPYIYHDLFFHSGYIRKSALTPENEIEFRELYRLSIEHNYPNIFKLIFEIFHESGNSNSEFPYSKYLFICNCLSLILFCDLVHTNAMQYAAQTTSIISYTYETLSFIKDSTDTNSNALDLSEFLFNCGYIDKDSYDKLCKYIQNDNCIFTKYRSRGYILDGRSRTKKIYSNSSTINIEDIIKSLSRRISYLLISKLYDYILQNIDREREQKGLPRQRVMFLYGLASNYI
jgi:hypothetical protein